MENFSLDGIIATVVLDTRRAKQDGLYPVKFRINYMRKQYYYASGINLELEQWNSLNSTRKRDLIEIREMIQSGFERIKSHIKELVKNEGFTFKGLVKRLSRGRTNSIFDAFDNKIEKLMKTGQIGTASTYRCSKKSIQKFTSKDLSFSDITIDWLNDYESYLTTERTEKTAKGETKIIKPKTTTTVKFYIEPIRSLMNELKGDHIISEAQYPFGEKKYEIKTGSGRKMALSILQLGTVLRFPLVTDSEKRSRDLWFFSYLCNGANFSDILKLKYKDISSGEIHFYRQKTIRTTNKQKEIVATLLPEMEQIIKRWGNTEKKPENYIFPFLSPGLSPIDQKKNIQNVIRLCNKKMAAISKALEYDTISTYCARHSYATVLKRSGANIAFISESLGHSNLKVTEHYLSSFESDERAKNAAKLTQF